MTIKKSFQPSFGAAVFYLLKHLAKNENICYTYDKLSRVISKTVEKVTTTVVSEETFSYDAAGNLTENYSEQGQDCFEYTPNNLLSTHNDNYVSHDKDGNITSVVLNGARRTLKYDSSNKLISAGQNAYTYNAENVRVKNLCGGIETTYVYDTNAKLSKLLTKTTGGVTTKYVYGRGLIGEETNGTFRTYHFDYRGSTVALTNINGFRCNNENPDAVKASGFFFGTLIKERSGCRWGRR